MNRGWSCPMCLVGACHRCTGHLTVHTIQSLATGSRGWTEQCTHEHPVTQPPRQENTDA
ncbi:hypothetical protein ACIBF5_29690 [Micromonospora sp. NPDC050417]|uniref:hypothetical protein n=1 Tax=Micromonospora sp. NPDC050417 TaxID=3364280 RepID=UPI00379E473C